MREQHPISLLRPPVPSTPSDFLSRLTEGMLVEVWHHEGWWQVIIKQVPGGPSHQPGRGRRGTAAVAAIAAAAAIAEGGEPPPPPDHEGQNGGGASSYVLESLQYGQHLVMKQPKLRPCWRWNAEGGAWSMVEVFEAWP